MMLTFKKNYSRKPTASKVVSICVFAETNYLAGNLSNGNEFNCKKTTISFDNKTLILASCHLDMKLSSLIATATDISLKIVLQDKILEVGLHPVIQRRMLNFLIKGDPVGYETYCCIDFMNELVLGRGLEPLNRFDGTKFYGEILPNKCYVNDSIVLIRHDNGVVHCAIYIGENLCMYKFGINGPIIISTLDQMIKAYSDTTHGKMRHVRLSPNNCLPTAYYNALKLTDFSLKILKLIAEYLPSQDQTNYKIINKKLCRLK